MRREDEDEVEDEDDGEVKREEGRGWRVRHQRKQG